GHLTAGLGALGRVAIKGYRGQRQAVESAQATGPVIPVPARRRETASLVRDGVSIGCARPILAESLCMLDACQFEDLVNACQPRGRWDCLFVVAPLRFRNATG